ncbi:methyltransferase domain-containing protein [Candidatus Peregrinibacteria bacterium]|nr:methyltransferase domain-containing protein [Candidatus Peregrinibacteria bacterium]
MQKNLHDREKGSSAYLGRIDQSSYEKCGVVRYLNQIHGPVVEIGPGGGSALIKIAHICDEMANGIRVVALDNNEDVSRKLKRKINNSPTSITNIDFVSGDASVEMPFEDNSIGAINASSVVHEIFSYGGGIPALKRFFKESCRVLQPGGYLVYRDPTGANLDQLGQLICQNEFAYAFLQFFLKKFLKKNLFGHYQDYKFLRKKEEHYKKGTSPLVEGEEKKASSDRVLNIMLIANSGLLREIARHYLTFLGAVAPEFLFTVSPEGNGSSVRLMFTKRQGENKFKRFISAISAKYKEKGAFEIEISREALSQFYAYMREKFAELTRPLQSKDVFDDPNKIKVGETIDPSTLNEQYENIIRDGTEVKLPDFLKKCCEWSMGEGSEYYTYGSPTAVISTVLTSSVYEYKKNESGYTCLCPVNFDRKHFDLIERTRHSRFLQQSFIFGGDGKEELRDRKTIIHFQKSPLEVAIARVGTYIVITSDVYLLRAYKRLLFILGKTMNLGDIKSEDTLSFARIAVDEARKVFSAMDEGEKDKTQSSINIKYPHIALAGSVASGKTTVASIFAKRGYEVVSLSDFIKIEFGKKGITNPTRADYRIVARDLRNKFGEDVLAQKAMAKLLRENKAKNFVIDGVRIPEEIDLLRSIFHDTILLAVDTPEDIRLERVSKRKRVEDSINIDEMKEVFGYEFGTIPGGTNLQAVIERADLVIDGRLEIEETEKHVIQILERGMQ